MGHSYPFPPHLCSCTEKACDVPSGRGRVEGFGIKGGFKSPFLFVVLQLYNGSPCIQGDRRAAGGDMFRHMPLPLDSPPPAAPTPCSSLCPVLPSLHLGYALPHLSYLLHWLICMGMWPVLQWKCLYSCFLATRPRRTSGAAQKDCTDRVVQTTQLTLQ